jgi:hypothetical protein
MLAASLPLFYLVPIRLLRFGRAISFEYLLRSMPFVGSLDRLPPRGSSLMITPESPADPLRCKLLQDGCVQEVFFL